MLYGSTESPIVENSEVAWSENLDGLGNFGPKQVIGNQLEFTYQVTAADIDNDGDMDVFAASQNNDKFVWYENLTVLGIVENKVKNLKIYPNPSSDTIFIRSQNEEVSKIEIYDILGKSLFVKMGAIKEVNITTLPVGLYFINVTSNKGKSVLKLLKN